MCQIKDLNTTTNLTMHLSVQFTIYIMMLISTYVLNIGKTNLTVRIAHCRVVQTVPIQERNKFV